MEFFFRRNDLVTICRLYVSVEERITVCLQGERIVLFDYAEVEIRHGGSDIRKYSPHLSLGQSPLRFNNCVVSKVFADELAKIASVVIFGPQVGFAMIIILFVCHESHDVRVM